jgi:hypothetical protein
MADWIKCNDKGPAEGWFTNTKMEEISSPDFPQERAIRRAQSPVPFTIT